jgi:hypothetical protein
MGALTAGPGCVLDGTHVTGDVNVARNGTLSTDGATIDGELLIANTRGSNMLCGSTFGRSVRINLNTGSTLVGGGSCSSSNSVGLNLRIVQNSGLVTVSDSIVGLDLLIRNNKTSPDPITVSNTSVGRNLDCHENTPPVDADDGTVVVDGKTTGECATKVSTPCPATGCSSSVSNDDTSVVVDVPGGGRPGTLTITLTPPPSDDGCGFGGGGDSPSVPSGATPIGSIVTVVPPAGYTAGNPIVVHITWTFAEFIDGVCKSNNGRPPFTALDECIFDGGTAAPSGTPTNVPCWTQGDASNEVIVYITSTDPAVSGH